MIKSLLMCKPTHFDIEYEINDWMSLENRVDTRLAMRQWQTIYDTYINLGHQIKLIKPIRGLPDMIFTANAGQVIDGRALVAKFKFPQRQPETKHFETWFKQHYNTVKIPDAIWEGEGDCLLAGDTLFTGYGFRSEQAAQAELASFFNRKVVGLHLVDPRFYHLDTCFCPLDDQTIMYFPGAFDTASQDQIKRSGFNLIEANETDATGYAVNAFSDGYNVVLSDRATKLAADLKNHGFEPILVDISEFKKSGGGVKCVTLELRP